MPAFPITSHDPAPRGIPHQIFPISIVALRAEACDGKSVVISLATKYSSVERVFSVPLECFHDLIVDLRRLNALTDTIETPISQ
jgi:hypothetical protein